MRFAADANLYKSILTLYRKYRLNRVVIASQCVRQTEHSVREESLPPFLPPHGTGKMPDVIGHTKRRYNT